MSIQRYDILHPKMRDKGRFILYADHIADKDADLHNLLSTLADIRAALGVGDKPMLSELAGIVRTRMGVIKILERDAEDNAAEVERLKVERDAAIARAERAEACLRYLYDLHARGVFNLPDEHYAAITNAAEVLSSHPADTSKIVGERKWRLADSLEEILNYSGGADNALEDEYVMERAFTALADMEQKS